MATIGSTRDSIIIRPWPKVVFLYPLMFTAFICGLLQQLTSDPSAQETGTAVQETLGFIFLAIFCLNLLVISFEFTRFRTMSIVFFLLAIFFLLLYLSRDWAVLDWLKEIFFGLRLRLSTSFYYCFGVYFLIIFAVVYVNTRFNYWQIKSNEILHKEGLLGDVRRFPSPNLRMNKEINDVFEFLLLGAGRIVLSPASERTSIVLDHVLRVNKAERKIQDLLSSLSVEIHEDRDDRGPEGIAGF